MPQRWFSELVGKRAPSWSAYTSTDNHYDRYCNGTVSGACGSRYKFICVNCAIGSGCYCDNVCTTSDRAPPSATACIFKENLEKLNDKTTEIRHIHCQTQVKTKHFIEETFNNLQNTLEERKKYLIEIVTQKDFDQQRIIREQKSNIEEHLKVLFIRELFTKQLLNCEDSLQLVQIKDDLINYNQLIQQQYEQLMEGYIFDLQHFTVENILPKVEQQLEDLGKISTDTFLTNSNDIYPLLKLSELSGEEKYQEFQGNYAYGYRFYLNTPFQLNSLRIKAALFNSNLTILILDHNDIIIQKETFNENSTTLKWTNIPINCEIQRNYCILIWSQPNEKFIPLIAYKDSNHILRQINEHISIRNKRAQINQSTNIDINTKVNVLYDALFNCDDNNKETAVPAIEMILHI